MRVRSRLNWIAFGTALSLVLPLLGSAASTVFFPQSRFAHLPIHSLIEACGGLMAIAIAGILTVEQPRKEHADHYPWMAGALVGMGVLDLFHAGVKLEPSTNIFVWLHSTATFVGGLMFSGVWLGSRGLRNAAGDRADGRVPWLVLAVTVAFGVLSCAFASRIPTMAVSGQFTLPARALNIGGGLGFLVAGVFFARRFLLRADHEDWLFAVHTILFGVAGILFEVSALWDAAWWWWHILRMAAYLAALTFAIRAYLDAEHDVIKMNRQLNEINRNLDLTVEKRAAELSHERFLLHTLLDHLPDAIYFKDTAGRFMRVSRALASRLNREPQEMIGQSDKDYFPAEYAARAAADEQELMRTGVPLIGKEENPHWIAGDQTWVSTTKVPLPDETGRIVGTFGISHDITAQKESQANFRRVIDAAPNPLVVVDDQGNIELVNAATRALFGYEQDELIGQPIEILVPDRLRHGHDALRREYLKNPHPRTASPDRQLSARRKDGSEVPVEIGLNPVRLSSRTAVLASLFDVTVRKQAEDALVAAKQAAEAANLAKSDFLANMSHEIRTPMNAIIGMTDLVLDTTLDSTQRDYLTIVSESADSLLSIINEILDFSKIEAGKLELESIDFDVIEEVGDTLKALGLRAHAKDLELAWQVHPDVPRWLCGDPVRLRQMLINLVNNAIKFTERGEVIVTVKRQETRDSQITLLFSVRDTGLGIAEDNREQIFAAFQQADTSTTRQFGGTGLGLAITSRIAEAMGGKVWVESKPGAGSTFHFTSNFQTGVARHEEEEPPDIHGLAVLVVDDNQTNRRIVKEILESWGMVVETTESGAQALDFLQRVCDENRSLPLVVSDVNMPEMDGFMLARQLRLTEALRDTAIIMLTSAGRQGDLKRCEELNVSAHLVKPVKHSELLDAVLRAVRPRSQSSAAPTGPAEEIDPLSLPPRNILLAEDGKANQKMAVGLLTKWGHQVTVAENGQDAIEHWQNDSFDLILMDVQMPILDGFQATQRIRELEQETGRHIPIIAMTARAMKGDRQRCLEAGMDDYVSKPVRKPELYRALSGLAPPARTEPAADASATDPAAADASATDPAAADASATDPAAADAAAQDAVVDWQAALETVGGDRVLLRDVIELTRAELPALVSQLETAIGERDVKTAQRVAHTIKGEAAALAAHRTRIAAAALEESTARGDLALATRQLPRLHAAIDELVRSCQDFATRQ